MIFSRNMAYFYLLIFSMAFCHVTLGGIFNFENNACPNLSYYPFWYFNNLCYVNPDGFLPIPSLIARHGYKMIEYQVVTEDGYILALYRVPSKLTATEFNKQPVYLQHGAFTNAINFLNTGNRSMVYNLVNHGYDVWMGNLRGSAGSKTHMKLENSDPAYWAFSLDEIQQYDIRAILKKVASVTGKPIITVGHSLGATFLLCYSAAYPEEAKSIMLGIICLSPFVYMPHRDAQSQIVSTLLGYTFLFMQRIGVPVFFYNRELPKIISNLVCRFLPQIPVNFMNLVSGTSHQFLPDFISILSSTYPDSIAVRVLMHTGQILHSNRLQKFDFGADRNLQVYGQERPPAYNLSNIEIPTYVLYGLNEPLVNANVVRRLISELGSSVKRSIKVPIHSNKTEDQFNHIDYHFAKYAYELFVVDFIQLVKTGFNN